ncbi:hypothetical protein QBC43DRAFT_307974 [Cladorrhinum sp. PSN259]|nr:hypothetical protein QBC43DRAFT_307974 [Cladorrhinum sp. PSN259]
MSTTTLWTLPAQPLPVADVRGATFVTIWTFITTGFAITWHLKLRKSGGAVPAEFKTEIRISTILLSIWYLAITIDRWMHYEQRRVPFGYIIFEPIVQSLQLLSTLFFLWGTYGVVWSELQRRFRTDRSQTIWWTAAKTTFFCLILVTCFFWILRIATTVVWLKFLSLNVISDVATKRNGFEMAMTLFFSVFTLLTVVAIVATFLFRANKLERSWARTRIYVVIAAVMLFGRSVAECAIAFQTHMSVNTRRADLQLRYDIVYGLMTTLYLLFMYLQARQYMAHLDEGSTDAEKVRSDIQTEILARLENKTAKKKITAPPLRAVIGEVQQNLEGVLRNPNVLSANLRMPLDQKRKVAESFLTTLLKKDGHLGEVQPDEGTTQQSPAKNRSSTGASPIPHPGLTERGNSAPPFPTHQTQMSSVVFDQLYSASTPALRNKNSVPDIERHGGAQCFAPGRQPRDGPSNSGGMWMPAVDEEESIYDLSAQRPQRNPGPTFTARAAASSWGDSSYTIPRNVSSPLPGPSVNNGYASSQHQFQSWNRSVSAGSPPPQTQTQQYHRTDPTAELHNTPSFQHRSELDTPTPITEPGPSRWNLNQPGSHHQPQSPPPLSSGYNSQTPPPLTPAWQSNKASAPGQTVPMNSGSSISPATATPPPDPSAQQEQQTTIRRPLLIQSIQPPQLTFPPVLRPGAGANRQRSQPASSSSSANRGQLSNPPTPQQEPPAQRQREYVPYPPPPSGLLPPVSQLSGQDYSGLRPPISQVSVPHQQTSYAETLPSTSSGHGSPPPPNPRQLQVHYPPGGGSPVLGPQYAPQNAQYHSQQGREREREQGLGQAHRAVVVQRHYRDATSAPLHESQEYRDHSGSRQESLNFRGQEGGAVQRYHGHSHAHSQEEYQYEMRDLSQGPEGQGSSGNIGNGNEEAGA